MMWNEILKKVDQQRTPMLAAKRWGDKSGHIQLINEGINLVYRYELNNIGYYLRLTHAQLRSKEELKAAINYQTHLFEHGAPVCEPIQSLNNVWFESIWQGKEECLAHVCREVPGQQISFDHPSKVYKTWGRALGQLHSAARSYDHTKYCYATWSRSIEELAGYVKNESNDVKQTLDRVSQFMHARSQSTDNYGLTHGDHREGNVLTDGTQVHIIDFDLPSLNWFTEDLFRPFFDSIIYNRTNWQDKIKPYIDGYLTVMPESSIDLHAFPWQIQMKCLEIYLWTKNNWSHESAPGGKNTKKWLTLIHDKIIQQEWMDKLSKLFN